MEGYSDTDSYTSSYTSYSDSYSDSYTYSTGSLTDSREFDEEIRANREAAATKTNEQTAEAEPVVSAPAVVEPVTTAPEPEPVAPVEPAKPVQTELENASEIQFEMEENPFNTSTADLTIIEATPSDQIDEPKSDVDGEQQQKVAEKRVENESDRKSAATDCCDIGNDEDFAYQSDFDENMRSFRERSRTMSQESYHSQPKSWSEFESENKQWRPVRLGSVVSSENAEEGSQLYTRSDSAKHSQTKSSNDSLDLTPNMSNCSEGYRSSSSRDASKIPLDDAEKKPKTRTRTRSYERPRRNMDDFLKSVISPSSGISSTMSRTESKESSGASSLGSSDGYRLEIDEKPFQIYEPLKPRKNSLCSTESESVSSENKTSEKIIRIKVTRTKDNRYTYGFITDDNAEGKELPLQEKRVNIKTATSDADDRTSFRSETLAYRGKLASSAGIRRINLPKRRDTFTKKFEQTQKQALSGIEAVYSRHSQRTSQLMMDLQISMAANGYGKFRNYSNNYGSNYSSKY